MADYYPLISSAIVALDNKSSEARRAVYDRARAALVNQLQNDPAFAFEHERLALEDAINKVEADTILSEGTWPTSEGLQVESDEPGLAKNIERSIRRGQGQDVTEIEAGEVPIGVAVLGIVLWLIFLGLCGFILWLWLSR
jgi:hypothetical protein